MYQPSLHLQVRQGSHDVCRYGPPHLTGWLILEGDDWVTGSIDVPPQTTLPQVLQRLEAGILTKRPASSASKKATETISFSVGLHAMRCGVVRVHSVAPAAGRWLLIRALSWARAASISAEPVPYSLSSKMRPSSSRALDKFQPPKVRTVMTSQNSKFTAATQAKSSK